MKSIHNPENGADIIDRPITTGLYTIKVGETKVFEDEVANVLLEYYGFLEEVSNAPTFTEDVGDEDNKEPVEKTTRKKK